jgi:hypothetical protein
LARITTTAMIATAGTATPTTIPAMQPAEQALLPVFTAEAVDPCAEMDSVDPVSCWYELWRGAKALGFEEISEATADESCWGTLAVPKFTTRLPTLIDRIVISSAEMFRATAIEIVTAILTAVALVSIATVHIVPLKTTMKVVMFCRVDGGCVGGTIVAGVWVKGASVAGRGDADT